MDDVDRRTLLRMGGPAVAIGLAGCESLDSGTETGTGDAGTTARTTTISTPENVAPECEYGTVEPDEPAGAVGIWHPRSGTGEELFETTRDRFENTSDSTLEVTAYSATHYDLELENEIPRDDGPQLFEWGHDQVTWFTRDGLLSDQSGTLDVDDCVLMDTALDAAEFDGERIGIPWAGETVALAYNEEMVEEPPETLEEMIAIIDSVDTEYGLGYPINPYTVSGFAQAYGEDIYDDEAEELGVDTDEVETGLRVVMDDLKPHMPSDPNGNVHREAFENGDAPFYISGPWDIPHIRSTGIDFGVTTLPDLPEGGTPRPYAGITLFYFTERMDEDPERAGAARNFVEWFVTNEEVLLDHAEEGDFVPVHTGLVDSGRLPNHIQAYAEQLQTADAWSATEKMDHVWSPFGRAVGDTFDGNGDLRENLEDAATEIRERWAEE